MNLVKILIATFAVSTVVSFTVALVRAKRHIDKVGKETEAEFREVAEALHKKEQRELRESILNTGLVKESIANLNETEQAMDASMDRLQDSILDQPAIKVGGKNKVDPLEFAKSIRPEDIKPI